MRKCLLLRLDEVLGLLQTYDVALLDIMTLKHLGFREFTILDKTRTMVVFIEVSSCSWPRVARQWCCWPISLIRWSWVLILLISVRALCMLWMRWSIGRASGRLSWLRRLGSADLFESVFEKLFSLSLWDYSLIFDGRVAWVFKRLDILILIVNLSTEGRGLLDERWVLRDLGDVWVLLYKVILKHSSSVIWITAIVGSAGLFIICLSWSSFLDFCVSRFLNLWCLWFRSGWLTSCLISILPLLFMVYGILVWEFWEGTGNSRIGVKALSCRTLLAGRWVLMTASTWLIVSWSVVLSSIFCSRSISIWKSDVALWCILIMAIGSMIHRVLLTILLILCTLIDCARALARTSLVLLGFATWSCLVRAAWPIFLLKDTSTHMECWRLLETKVALCNWLSDSILWRCFPGLFQILSIRSSLVW